jgi:hypothetical protein
MKEKNIFELKIIHKTERIVSAKRAEKFIHVRQFYVVANFLCAFFLLLFARLLTALADPYPKLASRVASWHCPEANKSLGSNAIRR